MNEHATLVQEILDTYTQWKQQRTQKEDLWQACWQAYHGETNKEDFGIEVSMPIHRPILFQAVENMHATLMSKLFPKSGKFFHVFGNSKTSQEKEAPRLEEILHHKLRRQQFQHQFGLYLKQLLVTGSSVIMLPWHYQFQEQEVKTPVYKLGIPVDIESTVKKVLKEQGPRFEVLNIEDVYVDEQQEDWRQGWILRVIRKPLGHVLNEARYGNKETLLEKSQQQRKGKTQEEKALEKEEVTLLEVWGNFEENGHPYENYVAVVNLETGTLLRFEAQGLDCGHPPFMFSRLIEVPNEAYGIGILEKSLGLQKATNLLTNQKLEILNLTINTPFTMTMDDDIFKPESLDYRPGAIIPVREHDTLRPLPLVAQNMQFAFQEIEDLKVEMMETTGALRLVSGALDGTLNTPRTATEITNLTQQQHLKTDALLMHIEQSALEPILQLTYALTKQFWVYPETLRFYDAHQQQVRFEEIEAPFIQESNCEIRVLGTRGQMQKESELEGLLFMLKTAIQIPPEWQTALNPSHMLKRMAEHLGLNAEDIFQHPNP